MTFGRKVPDLLPKCIIEVLLLNGLSRVRGLSISMTEQEVEESKQVNKKQ